MPAVRINNLIRSINLVLLFFFPKCMLLSIYVCNVQVFGLVECLQHITSLLPIPNFLFTTLYCSQMSHCNLFIINQNVNMIIIIVKFMCSPFHGSRQALMSRRHLTPPHQADKRNRVWPDQKLLAISREHEDCSQTEKVLEKQNYPERGQ